MDTKKAALLPAQAIVFPTLSELCDNDSSLNASFSFSSCSAASFRYSRSCPVIKVMRKILLCASQVSYADSSFLEVPRLTIELDASHMIPIPSAARSKHLGVINSQVDHLTSNEQRLRRECNTKILKICDLRSAGNVSAIDSSKSKTLSTS